MVRKVETASTKTTRNKSGRTNTTGILAVVDEDHPLIKSFRREGKKI